MYRRNKTTAADLQIGSKKRKDIHFHEKQKISRIEVRKLVPVFN
jgi:hypothetical protein